MIYLYNINHNAGIEQLNKGKNYSFLTFLRSEMDCFYEKNAQIVE